MAWVKLDDHFTDHPKVVQAGGMAAWLYVCGLTYAARYLTDGFIPSDVIHRLTDFKGTGKLAVRLVAAKLWEKVDGGYQIHDYLEYQLPAKRVIEERTKSADRVAAYRRRNGVTPPLHATENGRSNALGNAPGNGDVTPPPYPVPYPVPVEDENLERELPPSGAAVAADQQEKSAPVPLVKLSEDARAVLEFWRQAHGKRTPPKLNPTQAATLEDALIDLGLSRLTEAVTYMAARGVPELSKAINAARTKRQREEQGVYVAASPVPNGIGPKPRGSSRARHH